MLAITVGILSIDFKASLKLEVRVEEMIIS
jgi:hypothetical protein